MATRRDALQRVSEADRQRVTGDQFAGPDKPRTMPDESRRQTWEDRTRWPLTIAAILFLVAYAFPILRPDLAEPLLKICLLVTWVAWAAFVVDYVVRLVWSRDRVAFVRHNLLDLTVVALPLLRPLRLLRLVALLSVLNRATGNSLRGRVGVYIGGVTALLLFAASLTVLDAERGAKGATIRTFGDAVWWAVTTVSSVGYGNFPVTAEGRYVAVVLMLAGVALFGLVTAMAASWLFDRVREVGDAAATRADVDALRAEVRELRKELEREPGP